MLEQCLGTGIPLLGVRTDDPLNACTIIKHINPTKGNVITFQPPTMGTKGGESVAVSIMKNKKATVGIIDQDFKVNSWKELHKVVNAHSLQVVVLNPPEEAKPYLFDCGFLNTPEDLIRWFVGKNAAKNNVEGIVNAFRGFSLKEVLNISKIASSNGAYTPESVREVTRQLHADVKGLVPVNTDLGKQYYMPDPVLAEWCALDGLLFKMNAKLKPRGLIFSGEPGTGKTMGAKYIAWNLEIPLYKLDFASMLTKWQGEAERYLTEALDMAEQLSPCVLLMDEVDKLFVSGADTGATARCLSILLWWLQEHKTSVLTIMTSNRVDNVPKELYRSGRIDEQIIFDTMSGEESVTFVTQMHKWWSKELDVDFELPVNMTFGDSLTEADITARYMRWLKVRYLKTIKEN